MVCLICKKAEEALLENRNLSLYRCRACGHAFKILAKGEREHYSEDYFAKEHKNWFDNPDYPLFEFIHNAVTELKGRGLLRVLDAGCGKGDLLKYLKRKNTTLELYGIDLTDNNNDGIKFIKGDIMKDDIGCRFDVICNLAVIEHLDSPQVFLDRIKRLLMPGGIVITVTDNDDSMVYNIARIFNRFGISAPYNRLYSTHHLQCFSNRSLEILIKESGLSTIVHKRHNHPVAAVDYPEAGFAMMAAYKAAIWFIFNMSSVFDSGILQINIAANTAERGGS